MCTVIGFSKWSVCVCTHTHTHHPLSTMLTHPLSRPLPTPWPSPLSIIHTRAAEGLSWIGMTFVMAGIQHGLVACLPLVGSWQPDTANCCWHGGCQIWPCSLLKYDMAVFLADPWSHSVIAGLYSTALCCWILLVFHPGVALSKAAFGTPVTWRYGRHVDNNLDRGCVNVVDVAKGGL